MYKINLESREGWNNRHITPLPTEKCEIYIIDKDIDGEHITLCEWRPFDKSQYSENNMPSEGYLGTAKYAEGKYKGIGFNAWKQNNSEFIYWKYK